MKFNNFSLIASALAITLAAVPLAAKADFTGQQAPLVVAQARENGKNDKWERLGLTDAQKAQINEIKKNTRSQIEGILTEEQRQQARKALDSNQKPKNVLRGLNLTDEQRTQVRQIMQTSKQQMEAVLTPEQKQQLEQMKQQWRSRRQQNS